MLYLHLLLSSPCAHRTWALNTSSPWTMASGSWSPSPHLDPPKTCCRINLLGCEHTLPYGNTLAVPSVLKDQVPAKVPSSCHVSRFLRMIGRAL